MRENLSGQEIQELVHKVDLRFGTQCSAVGYPHQFRIEEVLKLVEKIGLELNLRFFAYAVFKCKLPGYQSYEVKFRHRQDGGPDAAESCSGSGDTLPIAILRAALDIPTNLVLNGNEAKA